MRSDPERFYFIGIGGIGMVSVAAYLRESGKVVSGSDTEVYSPSRELLHRFRIPYQSDFSVDHMLAFRPDVCVVGSIVGRTKNVQVERALELGIPLRSFPEVIETHIVKEMRQIVVTGTHGKTTTSALVAEGLTACGINAAFIIGGELIASGSSFGYAAGASCIIIEGDEYITSTWDPSAKFLHYSPDILIINNLEWDHIDAYPSLSSYLEQFELLLNKLNDKSVVVANWDDPFVRQLCAKYHSRCVTYSSNVGASVDYFVDKSSAVVSKDGTAFQLKRLKPKENVYSLVVNTPLIGEFNLMNATAAIATMECMGARIPDILAFMKSFKKVRRRLEAIFYSEIVSVYDDFGHHPTAVFATLAALRMQIGKRHRLIAVFEPSSSSSRRKEFAQKYARSFSPADRIIISPLKRDPRWKVEDHLDCEELARNIGVAAMACENYNQVFEKLASLPEVPSHIIFFSSGKFGELAARLAQHFKRALLSCNGVQ